MELRRGEAWKLLYEVESIETLATMVVVCSLSGLWRVFSCGLAATLIMEVISGIKHRLV